MYKALLPVLVFLLCGCVDEYRIETVITPDGGIERAIYQPAKHTPDHARNGWEQLTWADEIKHADWTGSIRQLPVAEAPAQPKFIAAWGRFKSPDAIPEHLSVDVEGFAGRARLERHYVITDYGLFREHAWEERLTDTVALDRIGEAKRALLDYLEEIMTQVVQEAAGEQFQVDDLKTWMHEDARRFASDWYDLYLAESIRQDPARSAEEEDAAIAGLFVRHGIDVPRDEAGDYDWEAAIVIWLSSAFKTQLKTSEGGALGAEEQAEIDRWMDGMGGEPEEENAILSRAWDKVVKQDIGEEAFEQRMRQLQAPLFGVHSQLIYDDDNRAFVCTLRLPGLVVESSGEWLDEHTVRWQFRDDDAFPLGYRMHARSLEPLHEAQARFPKMKAVSKRKELLRARDLAGFREDLREALVASAAAGTWQALDDLEAELVDRNDSAGRQAVERLRAFLER